MLKWQSDSASENSSFSSFTFTLITRIYISVSSHEPAFQQLTNSISKRFKEKTSNFTALENLQDINETWKDKPVKLILKTQKWSKDQADNSLL